MRKHSKSIGAGMMMSMVGLVAAALSILLSAGLVQSAPPNMLDNNLHVVDLTDLKSPLPLNAVSTTQVLWQTEPWEHWAGTPDWPEGGPDSVGYPSIIQNTHGQNQDGKYYLYYAQHSSPSGIGCAVSDTIDGAYTKLADLPGSTRVDSQVLRNEHYHYPPTPPNPGDPAHYSTPSVVWNQNEGKWFMYFHAYNHYHANWTASSSHPGEGWQMTSVATCSDISQNVWTPYKDSAYSNLNSYDLVPVLTTTDETWSDVASNYSSFQQLPNGQWLGFLRGTSSDGTPVKIGFATSSDGRNWTRTMAGPAIHQNDGGGGRDGHYRPGFIGYLGENEDGDAEYLVAWSESYLSGDVPYLIYGTTTDFVNFTRDPRGHAFKVGDGAISAWREGDYLYLFTGKDLHKLELDVVPEPATMALLSLGGAMILARRRPIKK